MSKGSRVTKGHITFWKSKKGKAIIITLAVIVVVFGVVIGGTGYYLSKINHTNQNDFGLASVPSDEVDSNVDSNIPVNNNPGQMNYASGDIISDPNIQNILLIGSDTRGNEKYGRSDTMLVLSLNKTTKQIKMVSFLRDLYVKINGLQDNRINASYSYGGPKLLIDTLQNNFRFKIDNYVRVDFSSFKKLIDMVGGVQVTLTQAEANEINNHPGTYFVNGETQSVKAGLNTLNGAGALAYSRIRHIDSDFGRTQRQRNVLAALMGSMKSSNVGTLMNVANEVLPNVQTDLSNAQIVELAMNASGYMSNIGGQLAVPGDGTYTGERIRDMEVLVPDVEKNKASVWKLLYNK